MTLPLDRIVPKLESPFWLWEEIEKLKCENAALLADNKRLEEDRRYLFYRPEYVAIEKLEQENAALRKALEEIATTAHCIALAGPLNTPTLQDAWGKFMKIDSMASAALAKKS